MSHEQTEKGAPQCRAPFSAKHIGDQHIQSCFLYAKDWIY